VLSRRLAFLIALLSLLSLIGGCSSRVPLYAPPQSLPSGVFIKVTQAYARGDRIYVETWMMNATQGPIGVDRDGFALRLSDGRVLPRSSGTFTRHTPYQLAPGVGRQVNVDFRSDDGFDGIASATLIVGGVSFGTDPMPRVAGEVALSTTYVPPTQAAPPAPPAAPPVQPASASQ
jgi:hypothetical protein